MLRRIVIGLPCFEPAECADACARVDDVEYSVEVFVGSSFENEYSVTTAAAPHAAMDRISRMKPRTIASRPEISITASRTRSSIVIGIG